MEFKNGNKAHLGIYHSEKSKEKMRQSILKGIKEGRIKIWNKGIKTGDLRKTSMEEISKNAKANPNYGMKNKHHSKKTKQKISLTLLGKPKSKEQIIKYKEWRKTQNPTYTSSIEIKIQDFFKQLGIEFLTHQYMPIEHGYQCDILIPSLNMVIECDGNYWHKYPIGREIDHIRTSELIEKGFKVLRLWENEIKLMNINNFKDKIMFT